MTIIFYTRCKQLEASVYYQLLAKLPPKMRIKNSQYKRWEDAHAHLFGKLLTQVGLKYLGIKKSLKELEISEYGKPYFQNQSFSFNISHSGEYIVCAVSTDEQSNLGIDLEKLNPIAFNEFVNIWTEKEKQSLINLKQFYKYWTRKEAVVKADGRGMHIPLNKIDVTKLEVTVDNKLHYLKRIIFDREYEMHIASATKITNVDLIYHSFDA